MLKRFGILFMSFIVSISVLAPSTVGAATAPVATSITPFSVDTGGEYSHSNEPLVTNFRAVPRQIMEPLMTVREPPPVK